MKHAVKTEFVAVLILLDKPPSAAADRLKCLKSRGEGSRSQPLDEEVRIRMRLEDQITRGVKLSC